ncbi:MAG TPA: hypothetical protein PLK35_00485 [Candidatus Moranbacteria bacterium]|nr:hypothetical protein [Candidatus Moranbacteria bacterium]
MPVYEGGDIPMNHCEQNEEPKNKEKEMEEKKSSLLVIRGIVVVAESGRGAEELMQSALVRLAKILTEGERNEKEKSSQAPPPA